MLFVSLWRGFGHLLFDPRALSLCCDACLPILTGVNTKVSPKYTTVWVASGYFTFSSCVCFQMKRVFPGFLNFCEGFPVEWEWAARSVTFSRWRLVFVHSDVIPPQIELQSRSSVSTPLFKSTHLKHLFYILAINLMYPKNMFTFSDTIRPGSQAMVSRLFAPALFNRVFLNFNSIIW